MFMMVRLVEVNHLDHEAGLVLYAVIAVDDCGLDLADVHVQVYRCVHLSL